MNIAIPGHKVLHLEHVVLDVNGTVAAGGKLIQGVREQMWALRQAGWRVHWITADTRGLQADLDVQVGWPAVRIKPTGVEGEAKQKSDFVDTLGRDKVVAIGNGSNDAAMLDRAALGIAVLGAEGLALDALLVADALAPSIHSALDMLLDPSRLVATLRK